MEILNDLWSLIEKVLANISRVWDWLNTTLSINILGISFDLDYSPLQLLGVGILVLIALWFIKSLIPMS